MTHKKLHHTPAVAVTVCAVLLVVVMIACENVDDLAYNPSETELYDIPIALQDTGLYTIDYATEIQTIFNSKCVACHNPDLAENYADLDMTSYETVMNSQSPNSPVVIPFEPDSSYLVMSINGTITPVMPPVSPYLTNDLIVTIRQWISEGAVDELPGTLPTEYSLELYWQDSTETVLLFVYDVPEYSSVKIAFLDEAGETIEELYENWTDVGRYLIPVDVSALEAGIYGARMKSGLFYEVLWFEIGM